MVCICSGLRGKSRCQPSSNGHRPRAKLRRRGSHGSYIPTNAASPSLNRSSRGSHKKETNDNVSCLEPLDLSLFLDEVLDLGVVSLHILVVLENISYKNWITSSVLSFRLL